MGRYKIRTNLRMIRHRVFDILRQYDRIIMCGSSGDYNSLLFSPVDHEYLREKTVDITALMSPRENGQPFALKYCVFLLFLTIIQSGAHSPIVDATYTLYLYYLDHEMVESEFRFAKQQPLVSIGHNMRGYQWRPNRQMATLLKAVLDTFDSLPSALRKGYRGRIMEFSSQGMVDGDRERRPPYDPPMTAFRPFYNARQ